MLQNKKRSPWPYMITAGLSIVVIVNGFMFYLSQSEPYDLVTENYYQKALQYDSVIQAREITNNKDWKFHFSSIRNGDETQFSITLSDNETNGISGLKGVVSLFRPSDAKLDHVIELIKVDATKYQSKLTRLEPGPWKLTVMFNDSDNQLAFYKKLSFAVSAVKK